MGHGEFNLAQYLPTGGPDSDTMPAPRHRLRLAQRLFVLLLTIVLARAVQLEWSQGDAFRAAANRPIERREALAALRGRIVARDGTVLAVDEQSYALAVAYRYLEQPANAQWLRQLARARLPRGERRDPQRLAAESRRTLAEIDGMQRRLAALCKVDDHDWRARTRRIQTRVARMADEANRRHAERAQPGQQARVDRAAQSWLERSWELARKILSPQEPQRPAHLVLAEELDYHVMVHNLTPEIVAEIESHADRYPGVRIKRTSRRRYPEGALAAHVVGHLGQSSRAAHDRRTPARVGLMGVERSFESLLAGTDGRLTIQTDRRGHVVAQREELEPQAGHDLQLTLDPDLQRAAESLLDRACRRRAGGDERSHVRGGAVVVMDAMDGGLVAAASAPRFDPNWFEAADGRPAQAADSRGQPFFDRVSMMCLPPGSVFKAVSACAIVEQRAARADEVFECQGFLNEPHEHRCAIYGRFGLGHGPLSLSGALAQSCNVYFFHHAGGLGLARLVEWTERFGFGIATGVDLAGEAAGEVPRCRPGASYAREHSAALQLSIGQGELTASPLQVVRMMASIANGGYLVRPHVMLDAAHGATARPRLGPTASGSVKIPGLSDATLAAVRRGLEQVVEDPSGTAYPTVRLTGLKIAGKTGTAQAGRGQDHAWFAGYVPAESPRFAFVVVLESAGGGGEQAGPVAREIVAQLRRLGYLDDERRGLAAKP